MAMPTFWILYIFLAVVAVAVYLVLSPRELARRQQRNIQRYGAAADCSIVYIAGSDRKLHAGRAVEVTPKSVFVYFDSTFLGVKPGHVERLSRTAVFNEDGTIWSNER